MCDALAHCTNLKKLKLCFRGISVEDRQFAAYGLTGLQELNLHCSNFSEGIMSLLLGLLNISGLQLELRFVGLHQGGVRETLRGLQMLTGAFLS